MQSANRGSEEFKESLDDLHRRSFDTNSMRHSSRCESVVFNELYASHSSLKSSGQGDDFAERMLFNALTERSRATVRRVTNRRAETNRLKNEETDC